MVNQGGNVIVVLVSNTQRLRRSLFGHLVENMQYVIISQYVYTNYSVVSRRELSLVDPDGGNTYCDRVRCVLWIW